MSADQTEYEIFLSYARLDNQPIPPEFPLGWVTAVRDHILADQRRYSTEPLRIFFDASEIKDMDDWRLRIQGSLRHSKVLLVCLSPNYFESGPCKWEWDKYLARSTHHLMGADTVATVYFLEVPGSNEQDNAKRLAELMRGNFTDLRPWFPAGARMMQEAEVQRRLDALGLSLYERIERARRARSVPGNVRRTNPFFVGRREELRRLHERLGVGAIGVVTAVHGLGGQGKTELAYHYANGYADWYQGGLWSLGADGKKELLPLLGELAFVPAFGYTPSDAEKADANLLGQRVLEELRKRCMNFSPLPTGEDGPGVRGQSPEGSMKLSPLPSGGEGPGVRGQSREAAALIILDNVSEPELLSAAQLANLPHPANWLRLVATTRLGPERLAKSAKQLATVAVDSLDEADALTLIREHQPNQQFPNAAEEAAARQIVLELGGFTLAVEQVAIYLGLNAGDDPPSAFLKRLRQDGLPSADELPGDSVVGNQMLHQQKQLGPILEATVAYLAAELPAVRTALQFAALLPPDSVPWPWLKELTAKHHPELKDVEWGKLKRRLEGSRLVTGGDALELMRMHRLVAAHLEDPPSPIAIEAPTDGNPSLGSRTRAELHDFVFCRAVTIAQSQLAPAAWELDALLVALPLLMERTCTQKEMGRMLSLAAVDCSDKTKVYRSLASAKQLLSSAHLAIRHMAQSDPGNAEWQRDLAVALHKLGNLAVAQGNLPEAQQLFVDAFRIAQQLAESDPDNAAWQRDLAVSLEMLGDLAAAQGDLSSALRLFADSFRIGQHLVASDPSNAVWQLVLSGSLERVGDLLDAQGNLPDAQHLFADSLRIRQGLAGFDPGNAAWQNNVAVVLNRLGDLAVQQGNLSEAQRHYAESVCVVRGLAESDVSNTDWQASLSVCLDNLGNLAVAQGNLPEAQRLCADSLRIRRRLAESDPGNAGWQCNLSLSLLLLGDLNLKQGNLSEAQLLCADSLRIAQSLAESDSTNAEWQGDVVVSYFKLGEALARAGRVSEGLWQIQQARRIALAARERFPDDVGSKIRVHAADAAYFRVQMSRWPVRFLTLGVVTAIVWSGVELLRWNEWFCLLVCPMFLFAILLILLHVLPWVGRFKNLYRRTEPLARRLIAKGRKPTN